MVFPYYYLLVLAYNLLNVLKESKEELIEPSISETAFLR
tara:strand:+ start:2608 stop:2724 length:117 start_codon:yes stop_codon:yes gene_type:complete